MDKFKSLLFNNRKALDLPITERTMEMYKGFNETVEVNTLYLMYDLAGYTWEINDGFIVGTGY